MCIRFHFRSRSPDRPAARPPVVRGSRRESVADGASPMLTRLVPMVLVVAAILGAGKRLSGQGFLNRNAGDDLGAVEDAADDGVSLLGDRARERQLDQARRLFAEERWSDAALVCDEILAASGDAFLRRTDAATRRSLKAEVMKLLREQPPAARRAYELLHGARAERLLEEAIAADDQRGMLEVARRWFNTPAGRDAAVIAAYLAFEDGQAAVAASWLERLADAAEDTPPVVDGRNPRSVASQAATSLADRARGNAATDAVRRQLSSPRDWPQHRGDPSRNPVVTASRPLLAARYRVPLTRTPGESRLLWQMRQDALGRGQHLVPVGTPVVVGDRVVVQTGWGLLAVEFTTGKRLWIGNEPQAIRSTSTKAWLSAGRTAAREAAGLQGVFEDATTAGLTAAAGLVIAVEPAATVAPIGGPLAEPGRRGGRDGGGNRLTAYDLSGRGVRHWTLPADGGGGSWYLGPPLAVGESLFALVEEKGGVRMDCIDTRTGNVQWSQPLADLEENRTVTGAAGRWRRLAGFTPALGEGVLVCPIGAGTVIAIDLATRSLSWAHRYRTKPGDDAMAGGRPGLGPRSPGDHEGSEPLRLRDAAPLIAGGRVLLTPPDSDRLMCLDLREGTPAWPHTIDGSVEVAGVVGGKVIVIGSRAVEAVTLDGGQRAWRTPWLDIGGNPSGRGLVTPERLILPLDSAEVVEVSLGDGRVAARSGARGGVIPGNLVACRGEIVSRSIDSLDVFHQVTTLESRLETAAAEEHSAWARHWRGEIDLEQGRVAEGLRRMLAAAGSGVWRAAPDALGDAFVFALRQDFAAAVKAWDTVSPGIVGDLPRGGAQRRRLTREIVSGFLAQDELERAWEGMRQLVEDTVAATLQAGRGDPRRVSRELQGHADITTPSDRSLVVSESRWLRGRLGELHARADADLRRRIDTAMATTVIAASAAGDPERRLVGLASLVDILGRLPAADDARQRFLDECDRLTRLPEGDASALAAAGRDNELLFRRRDVLAAPRHTAAGTRDIQLSGSPRWPLGRVVQKRSVTDREPFDDDVGDRIMVVPVAADPGALVPDMGLIFDARRGRLLVRDSVGGVIVAAGPLAPLALRADGIGGPHVIEASTRGRLLVVRSPGSVSAFDLAARSSVGGLPRDEPPLWSRTGQGPGGRDMPLAWPPRGAGHGGGRPAAQGRVPLGMVVSEADDAGRAGFVRGGGIGGAGVLHHDAGTLSLLDSLTGRSLWERHGLVRIAEVAADDVFACVIAPDEQESLVLAMDDGRVVQRCELPRRRERLGACGRRLVVVRPVLAAADRSNAAEVSLSLLDPVSGESAMLGIVPGESRAVLQDDRLFVLAPDGVFTAFSLAEGAVEGSAAAGHTLFRVELPEMPRDVTRLQVIPSLDRLLVIAGKEDAAGMVRGGQRMSVHRSFFDRDMGPPIHGAIWAIDRQSGVGLWTAPAQIDGHCLLPSQPAGLPLLLLCRQVTEPRDEGRARLGLLCLDKRTGHAVVEELELRMRPEEPLGCDVSGDPDAGTVTVRQIGGNGSQIVFHFTGEPIPPRPPYREPFCTPDSADPFSQGKFEGLMRSLHLDRSQ
jgi:hypothetical protein